MKCIKCGTNLQPSAVKCPECGTPVSNKKKLIVYVIAGLAVIALIAIVFAAIAARGNRNLTGAPGGVPVSGQVTVAPPGVPVSGQVTVAPPGVPAPPDTTPSNTPVKVPQAVLDYLEHVKKVEAHRQMLLKDTQAAYALAVVGQAQGLMDMLDMAGDPDGEKAKDPLAAVKKELNRQDLNWRSAIVFFDKVASPNECRDFSGAYRMVIYNETKTIDDVAVSLNAVDITNLQDISKLAAALQKMKSDPSIQKNIDDSADNADSKLKQLCSYYGITKPFDVPRETSGGSVIGF